MNTKEWPEIFSRVEKSRKAENKKAHSMNAKLIFSLSWLAAVTLTASPVNAAPRRGGGGHGHGHMSMPSRGGATFSRGGNWSGRNWNGRNWSGGNQFIFSGGFGYPYYWDSYPSWSWGIPYVFNYGYYSNGYYPSYGYGFGYPYYWDSYPSWSWSIPYAFNYDYYSYGYNPSYRYDYGYYSDPAYGYGYADRSSIAQLQRRLARAGYYYGAIDGIMGSQTRRAIRAYERAYGTLSMR
jgi:hypothetical protein